MADPVVGTQAGAGTAGASAAGPAQAQPAGQGAAQPGGQAGNTAGAAGGSVAGSPAAGTVDRAADLERRLTAQGRELAAERAALLEAERRFGPRTNWEKLAAEAATPAPNGAARQQGAQPAQAVVAPQAPPVDPAEAQRWSSWANGQYGQYLAGSRHADLNTGEEVVIPPDPAGARNFAVRMDPVLRGLGVTPPWEGNYGLGQQQTRQQANADGTPLTREQLDQVLAQRESARGREEFRQGRQFDRAMRALPQNLGVGQDFLNALVDVPQQDGTTLKVSRAEAIEDFCVERGITPDQAADALFRGDIRAAWRQQAYNDAMSQAKLDQMGIGPGSPVRTAPFPEPTVNDEKMQRLERVNAAVGGSAFGRKPAGAADVDYSPDMRPTQ